MVTQRVGCYLRVSTRESAEDGWSIGCQYGDLTKLLAYDIHLTNLSAIKTEYMEGRGNPNNAIRSNDFSSLPLYPNWMCKKLWILSRM